MTTVLSVRGRLPKLGVVAITVVVAAGVLAACDPVLHPNFAIKEQADSAVAFVALSGNGQFVVVRSTGAGATVPGAGCWRVGRADGSVVRLSTCDSARISNDGRRVLLGSGRTSVFWSSGTTLTPPSGLFSKDLTFEVFRDTDGAIKTWSSADQSVTSVETAFPRPSGTTAAAPSAISNDGRKVEYRLDGALNSIERFVDLDTKTKVDRSPNDESFLLAASGNGFLDVHNADGQSWAELTAFPSGTILRRYTNTSQESLDRWFIADDGAGAWVYQEHDEILGPDCVNGPPPAFSCAVGSHTIFFSKLGVRTFDTGPNPPGAMDTFGHGRFLLFDKFGLPQAEPRELRGPVMILDWTTGNIEKLTAHGTFTETNATICSAVHMTTPCTLPASSTHASVSDDLKVVVTATNTGNGWYEYTTSP